MFCFPFHASLSLSRVLIANLQFSPLCCNLSTLDSKTSYKSTDTLCTVHSMEWNFMVVCRLCEIRLMCTESVWGGDGRVYIFKKKINRMYQQKWVNDLLFNTFASSTWLDSSPSPNFSHKERTRKKRNIKGNIAILPSACTHHFCTATSSVHDKYGKWSIYLLFVSLLSRSVFRSLPGEMLC